MQEGWHDVLMDTYIISCMLREMKEDDAVRWEESIQGKKVQPLVIAIQRRDKFLY